jgi:folate-binding protein YgfZ
LLINRLLTGETAPISTPATCFIAKLPRPFVIEVAGSEASKVVNNLSTNDILKLPSEGHCETFITDVRGWVVAHAVAIRRDTSLWLIGSHESASKICNHLDRYIIREDATVHDRSADLGLVVFDPGPPSSSSTDPVPEVKDTLPLEEFMDLFNDLVQQPLQLDCPVPVISSTSRLLTVPLEQVEQLSQASAARQWGWATDELFAWRRISNFWPQSPADIGDKTIPQELDRDRQAISFTKGCYLGQETIARLDARGQLQKKLCLVDIVADNPEQPFQVGDPLKVGEKEVGQITSVARDPSSARWRALALLRRGNFAPGTQLQCQTSQATVLEIPG